MNSILSKKNLFFLAIAIGFAIPVLGMDVPRGGYQKLAPNEERGFQELTGKMTNKTIKDQEISKALDANKALLNKMDRKGSTLLFYAATAGRLPAVQRIIDEGFDFGIDGQAAINQLAGPDTPLAAAAGSGHLDVVKYLLDMGPTEANIRQAIHRAQSKHPNIVQLLQQRIAPTQSTATRPVQPPAVQPATRPGKQLTEEEQLALAIAESLKAQPAVQPAQPRPAPASRELEGLDALKNIEGRRYREDYQAIQGIAGNIINKGNLPNATQYARTAIQQNKSLVNIEMQFGRTLLILAVQNGRTEIARALLDAGANINYPDENGNTPLMLAAQNGNLEIVHLLLDRGATINLFNKKKQTALNLALIKGHQNVVTLLVQRKAKLFFTLVIAFTPPHANQLARDTYQNLQCALQQSQQQDQINNIKVVPLEEVHLSMLYCSFLIDYNDLIEATTQSIFDTVYTTVERFGLKERCVNLTRSHQFLFTGLEKMGPYVVIRYKTPQGYQQLINELFGNIQQAIIQVPVIQTYGETQNPHISIAQEVIGRPKFTVDLSTVQIQANPLNTQAFQHGVYELNMRVPALGNLTRKSKALSSTKHAWNAHATAQLLFA